MYTYIYIYIYIYIFTGCRLCRRAPKRENRCWRPPKLDVRWRNFWVWMPRAAWNWIFIDLCWFSLIFIDFHWFSWIWEASKSRKSNPLWQPVAACGGGMDSPIYRFLRFWRHPDLLDDECKIDGSGAGSWRLLDDEWKADWKKFPHARAWGARRI